MNAATTSTRWGVHEPNCPAVPPDPDHLLPVDGPCRCRADRLCWKCGERVSYDGWDHVHESGLGVGSCRGENGRFEP